MSGLAETFLRIDSNESSQYPSTRDIHSREKVFCRHKGQNVNRELWFPNGIQVGRTLEHRMELLRNKDWWGLSIKFWLLHPENYFVTTLATHWEKQLSLKNKSGWEFLTISVFQRLVQNSVVPFMCPTYLVSLDYWTSRLLCTETLHQLSEDHNMDKFLINIFFYQIIITTLQRMSFPIPFVILVFPL